MPLNIGATGSIKPYVKFNAKADKWFAKGETWRRRDRPADLHRRPAQHRHRLASLPRGPGAGARDGQLPGPRRAKPRQWLQARLRARGVQPEVLRRLRRAVQRLDPHGQCHPGGLFGLRGGAWQPSGPSAGDRLHRLGAHEGSLRHQLPPEARDREVGGPAGRAARPEPGRAHRRCGRARRLRAPGRRPCTCRLPSLPRGPAPIP